MGELLGARLMSWVTLTVWFPSSLIFPAVLLRKTVFRAIEAIRLRVFTIAI